MASEKVEPGNGRADERTFTVAWSDPQRRYIAADENGRELGASPDMEEAIAGAVQQANIASREGCRVTVKVRDGNLLKTEYVAQPRRGMD
jgi:hypothetical protein